MTSQLASLAWKEFRERKWLLLAGTAWMVLGVIYAVAYELGWKLRAPVGSFGSTCGLYALFMPILLAMQTSVGEVTRRTHGFSRALPVSTRRLAWARLLGAAACIVIPIVVGALLISLTVGTGLVEQALRRPTGDATYVALPERGSMEPLEAVGFAWTAAAINGAAGVEFLLILCFIGARRRTESHVGFVGAVLAIPWMLAGGPIREDAAFRPWYHTAFPQAMSVNAGYGTLEGAHYTDLMVPDSVWLPLAGNLVLLAALGTWFAYRYATRPESAVTGSRRRWWRPRLPALLSRLPISWPGRTAALIWLDLRQAVPLALAGLMIAILFSAVNTRAEAQFQEGLPHLHSAPARIAGALPGVVWVVGTLWGVVVGAGIFASELRPNLQQFWQSRPISPSSWFWGKYVCGLVAVLVVLDLVAIVAGYQYAMFVQDEMYRISTSYIACFPLMHAWMYSLAVAGVCWLRKPMWGALCAFGIFMAESVVTSAIPGLGNYETLQVYNSLNQDELQGQLNLWQHGYPVVYGAMALMTIGAALVARYAIARDDT